MATECEYVDSLELPFGSRVAIVEEYVTIWKRMVKDPSSGEYYKIQKEYGSGYWNDDEHHPLDELHPEGEQVRNRVGKEGAVWPGRYGEQAVWIDGDTKPLSEQDMDELKFALVPNEQSDTKQAEPSPDELTGLRTEIADLQKEVERLRSRQDKAAQPVSQGDWRSPLQVTGHVTASPPGKTLAQQAFERTQRELFDPRYRRDRFTQSENEAE